MSNTNQSINEAGLELIKEFEGCILSAYKDPVGIWTIGYGHTKDVHRGDMITEAEAETLLIEDLKIFEKSILELVDVFLTSNQFSALCSFVYNIGVEAFRKSTMRKKLNDRNYDGAAEEFGKWIHAGGRILQGLVRRREAEKKLFSS